MSYRLAVILLTAACFAQEAPLAGPVTGWIHDASARALRPMIGSPGSAHLGPAVEGDIDLAAFAPGGRRVAVVKNGTLLFGEIGESGWRWHRLAKDSSSVASIAWDRSGKVMATYDAASRRLTLWRNLVRSPEPLALAEPPAGKLISLIAGDDAVVAGFEEGDTGAVYRVTVEGAQLLASASRPVALLFTGDGRDLYIADHSRGDILRVANYREPAGIELIAGTSQGVDEPSALSLSKDGRTLTIATKDALLDWDLEAAAAVRRIELAFRPTKLEPLGAGAVFLLTSRARIEDVLQVLDLGGEPVVRFVPAGEIAAAESVR